MESARFAIHQEGPTVSVCPQEPVVTSQQMRELIDDVSPHLAQGAASNVVFDMSKVEYLDSACIARLFTLLRSVQEADGRIALAHCQPNVSFLLEMTHMDELFSIFDDLDAALSELRRLL